jgi:hypothetical protein
MPLPPAREAHYPCVFRRRGKCVSTYPLTAVLAAPARCARSRTPEATARDESPVGGKRNEGTDPRAPQERSGRRFPHCRWDKPKAKPQAQSQRQYLRPWRSPLPLPFAALRAARQAPVLPDGRGQLVLDAPPACRGAIERRAAPSAPPVLRLPFSRLRFRFKEPVCPHSCCCKSRYSRCRGVS